MGVAYCNESRADGSLRAAVFFGCVVLVTALVLPAVRPPAGAGQRMH